MSNPPHHRQHQLSEHFKRLNSGKFHFACERIVFSPEEINLIETYGHWLQGLESGDLEPFTEKQGHFLAVIQHKAKPETDFEKAWAKYIFRRDYELQYHGLYTHEKTAFVEDDFFSREDYKTLHYGKKRF